MSKQNTVTAFEEFASPEAVTEDVTTAETADNIPADFTLENILFIPSNKEYKKGRKLYLFFKRLFDIVVSLFGIVIFALVFPFVSLAIVLESRGNPLFLQERIGKNGRCFKIIKFRSMYADNDLAHKEVRGENGFSQAKGDPRVTKVGRFLRNFSIDELPQFINVFKGDMSLIGPRPFIPSETWQLSKNHIIKRLSVRPGITGLAQINGRSNASLEQREEWDLYYVDNIGPWLDLKIFFSTFWVVITKRDVL